MSIFDPFRDVSFERVGTVGTYCYLENVKDVLPIDLLPFAAPKNLLPVSCFRFNSGTFKGAIPPFMSWVD
jgi:hypothetical protein